jgi:hypothetical protein
MLGSYKQVVLLDRVQLSRDSPFSKVHRNSATINEKLDVLHLSHMITVTRNDDKWLHMVLHTLDFHCYNRYSDCLCGQWSEFLAVDPEVLG